MKKRIFIFPILAVFAFACSSKNEPCSELDNHINIVEPKLNPNTAQLVAYKSNIDKRKVVMAMHYNWGTKPGYSLINTPDSLDIVVLKNNYELPNDNMLKDLKEVQSLKATRVIPSIDMQEVSDKAESAIASEYKSEKKLLDISWKQNGNRPKTDAEVEAEYNKLKEGITAKLVGQANEWLQSQIKNIPFLLDKVGYNGISMRVADNNNIFTHEATENALKAVTALAGKGKKHMFIVESPNEKYRDYNLNADFIVGYKANSNDYIDFIEESKLYPESRYLPAFDTQDEKLKVGYKNNPTFSAEGVSKDKALLSLDVPNMAGVAVYHSEKYYYETADVNGFVNPYVPFKVYINAVNSTNKK